MLRLSELALVFMRLGHVASFIVKADYKNKARSKPTKKR
jgi:hypothetical protein